LILCIAVYITTYPFQQLSVQLAFAKRKKAGAAKEQDGDAKKVAEGGEPGKNPTK
jgi:hypothetical protein